MAEIKEILFIVESMGGSVFTYIVDLVGEIEVKNPERFIGCHVIASSYREAVVA